MILASLIGTYLDLLFTGVSLYSFPGRPFGDIFSIDIRFTLFALPVFTLCFLFCMKRMNLLQKALFVMILGIIISVGEQITEQIGLFIHLESWHHFYSFFGYTLFMIFIWLFYQWCEKE